ncbi:hypothetical protein PTKIN_Ptkin05aG0183200 [Pterospermum kingtungense]
MSTCGKLKDYKSLAEPCIGHVEISLGGAFLPCQIMEQHGKPRRKKKIDYAQPISKEVKKNAAIANGDSQTGTVGCLAVDGEGNLASATSTGGLVNKMVGRIRDSPIIGAGTYANHLCAVSATGQEEAILRGTVARVVAALFTGLSLKEAAAYPVDQAPPDTVGLVAVSSTGELTMPFNAPGMFRACATEDVYSEIAI